MTWLDWISLKRNWLSIKTGPEWYILLWVNVQWMCWLVHTANQMQTVLLQHVPVYLHPRDFFHLNDDAFHYSVVTASATQFIEVANLYSNLDCDVNYFLLLIRLTTVVKQPQAFSINVSMAFISYSVQFGADFFYVFSLSRHLEAFILVFYPLTLS